MRAFKYLRNWIRFSIGGYYVLSDISKRMFFMEMSYMFRFLNRKVRLLNPEKYDKYGAQVPTDEEV
jgi:hypothetical protein